LKLSPQGLQSGGRDQEAAGLRLAARPRQRRDLRGDGRQRAHLLEERGRTLPQREGDRRQAARTSGL